MNKQLDLDKHIQQYAQTKINIHVQAYIHTYTYVYIEMRIDGITATPDGDHMRSTTPYPKQCLNKETTP